MFFGGIITQFILLALCAAEDAEAVAAVSEEAPAAAAVPAGAGKTKIKDYLIEIVFSLCLFYFIIQHPDAGIDQSPILETSLSSGRSEAAYPNGSSYRPSSQEGHARATVLLREL